MQTNVPEDINKKRLLSIIINILLAVILIVPNILFLKTAVIKIPIGLLLFDACSVLALLSLSIYNMVRFSELEIKKQEVEFQKLRINTLNNLIDSLRGFKHNFSNIVHVIGGYLSLNDIDGLKKYHSQMNSEIRKINNTIHLNSCVKNNPAIYGLLLSKISYSEIKDITFNINILSDISANIKTYDFCKVLGILLDNAFEAANESKDRFVELNINENTDKKTLCISISNSCSDEVNIEKIFESGYTTKDGHSGFGLWEVKKLLSRYKNYSLETNAGNNTFTQSLEIHHRIVSFIPNPRSDSI